MSTTVGRWLSYLCGNIHSGVVSVPLYATSVCMEGCLEGRCESVLCCAVLLTCGFGWVKIGEVKGYFVGEGEEGERGG